MSYHPDYTENRRKSKRKRKQTDCSVIRQDYMRGCGICGSENIANHGVKFCMMCGREAYFLVAQDGYFTKTGVTISCNCEKSWTNSKGKTFYYTEVRFFEVKECVDCGAVCSWFCPNCKDLAGYINRMCWKSMRGRLFCQNCNFRRPEVI